MTTSPKIPPRHPEPVLPRRTFLAAGGVTGLGALLAACSTSGSAKTAGSAATRSGGASPATTGAAKATASPAATVDMATELKKPATLTFWTWVPHIQKQIDIFEKAYPNIKVNLVNAGQGAAQYTKLHTALKAGKGAPDVVQIEYLELPTFLIANGVIDLVPYDAAALQSRFVDWVWGQVADAGHVYAIPQDSGPMGTLYREDILRQHGIPLPTTWSDFATAAADLHKASPATVITDLASNDPNVILGFIWQAGGRAFSRLQGDSISITIDSAEARKVLSFWSPLISEGLVATDADFTTSWYHALATGRYATWLTAAWGPIFLTQEAAPTSGKWRVAPLPQWSAGANASANLGGSTNAVTVQSKYPAAAAELAMFINTNADCTKLFTEPPQFLFPTLNSILKSPSFTGAKLPFYGNQQVNEVFAKISSTVNTNFVWSPFEDAVGTAFTNTLGKAMAQRTDLVTGLEAWQAAVVKYAKGAGLKVTT